MEVTKPRLRINFKDPGILSKTQKKLGLKHSWVLLKPHFLTISDVIAYLIHSFDLHDSCPHGIILHMDGFVLPPFESTAILKDKDLISVKRKGSGLCDTVKAIENGRLFIEDEIIEKQPLPSAVRLLENEELDKETGGYQSENDEDNDEAEEPVKSAQGDVASKKRKASSKVETSKKKRQRQVTPESFQKKDTDRCEHVKTPRKERKLSNWSKHEITVDCTKNSEPRSKSNELKEKREKNLHASGVPDQDKKTCRSTLRKRKQRKWRKVERDNSNVNEPEKQLTAKDLSKDFGSKNVVGTNIEHLSEEYSDGDDDLVPVEIRPGHIRFTPSGKATLIQESQEANGWEIQSTQKSAWEGHTKKNGWDVNKNKVAKESFCWNGITNKRKGQKWGRENQPTSWKESRDYNSHSSSSIAVRNQPTSSWKEPKDGNAHSVSAWASRNQRPNDAYADFEKLVPLTDLPKVGDVIAYRLLELSSTWCPELSLFRVGKISWFDQESNKIMVVPEPEYPLNLERKADDDHDEDDSGQPPQPSSYNEDGSLEIDFTSLVDVRIVKHGNPSQSEATVVPAANGTSDPSAMSKRSNKTEDGSKNGTSDAGNGGLLTPAAPENREKDNGKKDAWEEISEALSAKKAQLLQEDSWNKKETSTKRSWSHRTLKSSALGPTMAMLRAQNGV